MKPAVVLVTAFALTGFAVWLATGRNPESAAGAVPVGPGGGAPRGTAIPGSASSRASLRAQERPSGAAAELAGLRSRLVDLRPGDTIDMDVWNDLKKKLDRLDEEGLLAVLRELDAVGREDFPDKLQLELLIAGALARKDPRLSLDHFVHRLSDGSAGMSRQMSLIFRSWAAKDARAAAEWLDRRIAEGLIGEGQASGRQDVRSLFESALIRSLAAADPGAATARIAGLSGPVKDALFRENWFPPSAAGREMVMADFLRAQAGDSPALLAAASSERISHGGSKELAAFMESIVATPDERSAIVSEALKRRIVGGLELGTSPRQAREWILELAPHDADRLTGIALGQLAGWHDFAGMAELALRYRDESGTDEVLVAFLANAPPGSREEILALAGEIGDPAERDGILRRFSGAPGRAEPPADDGF